MSQKFDMQKAREILKAGCPGFYIPDNIWASLSGALDHIAELEATQKQLSAIIAESENITVVISQEKELADLEKKLVESNHRCLDLQYMVDSDTLIMEKQRAALKKLGPRSGKRGTEDTYKREPVWKVTEDRKRGLKFAIELMELPSQYDSEFRKKEGYRGVLQDMLQEARP